MTAAIYCLVVLAGLLFGSFLNVCIYRLPRDLSVVMPRSFCPECGVPVSWIDNLPLLSYLMLGGRCRNCSQPITLRYPLVELITAIVFGLLAMRYGISWNALKWATFCAILIVLFWTDIEERLLPDECTLGGVAVGVVWALFVPVPGVLGDLLLANANRLWQSLLNAVAGALVLAIPVWMFGALWGRVRGREALGLGDVKLLALIGVFLGVENGLVALTIAAVSGAVIGILLALLTRKSVRTYELPFGSFLCAAAIVVVIAKAPAKLLGVP
jgi:leader peptidase (prepilin peptidase)/N-methyltransferase